MKKFLLSAFVIGTFIAYLFHERHLSAVNSGAVDTPAAGGAVPTQTYPPSNPPADTPAAAPTAASQTTGALYKNGVFTGQQVDVYYGLVQVQAVIQNGKITDVKFLDYPHDRRTSQEINNQVMPWLTQEAVQAQTWNVDLISGATLTSEGFVNSLQSALQAAKN